MGQEHDALKLRERVRVVKFDRENPEKEPEIVEQETLTAISLDSAALLGFTPGHGFRQSQPGDCDRSSTREGVTVGDQ